MNRKMKQVPIQSSFGAKTKASDITNGLDLSGKNSIVTGGYSGIGLEMTKALVSAGANVIIGVKTTEKANKELQGIKGIEMYPLDLINPESIDSFADWYLKSDRPLHILINSAGIMAPPLRRDGRGYESQFAINHLGHFQLTARLWPALKQANGARVIAVSSRAQRLGGVNFDDLHYERTEYNPMKAYAQSKTANVLFAVELDKRGKEANVRAFAAHPGLVPMTDLGRSRLPEDASLFHKMFMKYSPKVMKAINGTAFLNLLKKRKPHHVGDEFKNCLQGAATPLWCAVSSDLDNLGGVYCEDCNISETVTDPASPYGVLPWAIDEEIASRLWEESERLTGVEFKADF